MPDLVQVVPLLTTREAAEVLGMSYRTLQKWRMAKRGPKWIRLAPNAHPHSTLVRYRYDDIMEYIEMMAPQSPILRGNNLRLVERRSGKDAVRRLQEQYRKNKKRGKKRTYALPDGDKAS